MPSRSRLPLTAWMLVVLTLCATNRETPGVAPERGQPLPPAPAPRAVLSDAELKALAAGNNAFAVELYRRLAEEPGNVVASPYSVSSALAMMSAGARGQTAQEMAKVLGFAEPGERLHAARHALAGRLDRNLNVGRQEFRSRNALWLNKQTPFEADFLRVVQSSYDATANAADFEGAPEAAVGDINKWAEKETNGRIRNLLEPRDVPRGTSLVLANATYLKGLWRYPFDPAKTEDAAFHTAPGHTARVKMMRHFISAQFWEGDGVKVAAVPYRDGTASLMLVVPDRVDGLAAVEAKLTPKVIDAWYAGMAEGSLSLRLPRFTVRDRRGLGPSLKALGMVRAFDRAADFTGISAQNVVGSKVIHEAVVELNEDGAEAAAVTAVVGVVPVSAQVVPKTMELTVDRPFLFALYDHTTGAILFVGRVVSPG